LAGEGGRAARPEPLRPADRRRKGRRREKSRVVAGAAAGVPGHAWVAGAESAKPRACAPRGFADSAPAPQTPQRADLVFLPPPWRGRAGVGGEREKRLAPLPPPPTPPRPAARRPHQTRPP